MENIILFCTVLIATRLDMAPSNTNNIPGKKRGHSRTLSPHSFIGLTAASATETEGYLSKLFGRNFT